MLIASKTPWSLLRMVDILVTSKEVFLQLEVVHKVNRFLMVFKSRRQLPSGTGIQKEF